MMTFYVDDDVIHRHWLISDDYILSYRTDLLRTNTDWFRLLSRLCDLFSENVMFPKWQGWRWSCQRSLRAHYLSARLWTCCCGNGAKWQWFRSRSTSVLYMFWNETPAERPRCDVIPEHFHWVTARLMFHGLWVTLCYIIDQPSAVQFLFPVRLHRGSSASSVLHCPRWTLGKLCFNFIGVQISN